MGKRKSDDGWWKLLLLLLAAGGLYYTQVGLGRENDAALIPNNLEGQIDRVVAELNKQFGKRWVDWGVDALRSQLQKVLPPPLVALVSVVAAVEQMSRNRPMSSYEKQQTAIPMALAR